MRCTNLLSSCLILCIFSSTTLLGVSPLPAQARPLEGTGNNTPRRPMTAEEFERRYNRDRYNLRRERNAAHNRAVQCWRRPTNSIAYPRPPVGLLASRYACSVWQNTGRRVPPGSPSCGWGRWTPEQARSMGFKPERGDCN